MRTRTRRKYVRKQYPPAIKSANDLSVDEKQFEYLLPLWPVLENNPDGIPLAKALKLSGLERQKTLNTLGSLVRTYQNTIARVTTSMLSRSSIVNMIEKMKGMKDPKLAVDDYENNLVRSWIFDKYMLQGRIQELDFSDMVPDLEAYHRLKNKWLSAKGM